MATAAEIPTQQQQQQQQARTWLDFAGDTVNYAYEKARAVAPQFVAERMDVARAKAEDIATKMLHAESRKELVNSLPEGFVRDKVAEAVSRSEKAYESFEKTRLRAVEAYQKAREELAAKKTNAVNSVKNVIDGVKSECRRRVEPVVEYSKTQLKDAKDISTKHLDSTAERIFTFAEKEMDTWLPDDEMDKKERVHTGINKKDLDNLTKNTVSPSDFESTSSEEANGQENQDFTSLRDKYTARSKNIAKALSKRFTRRALSKLTDLKVLSEDQKQQLESVDLIEYARTHFDDLCNDISQKAADLVDKSTSKHRESLETLYKRASEKIDNVKSFSMEAMPENVRRTIEDVSAQLTSEKENLARKLAEKLGKVQFVALTSTQAYTFSEYVAKTLIRSTVVSTVLNLRVPSSVPFAPLWEKTSNIRVRVIVWAEENTQYADEGRDLSYADAVKGATAHTRATPASAIEHAKHREETAEKQQHMDGIYPSADDYPPLNEAVKHEEHHDERQGKATDVREEDEDQE